MHLCIRYACDGKGLVSVRARSLLRYTTIRMVMVMVMGVEIDPASASARLQRQHTGEYKRAAFACVFFCGVEMDMEMDLKCTVRSVRYPDQSELLRSDKVSIEN